MDTIPIRLEQAITSVTLVSGYSREILVGTNTTAMIAFWRHICWFVLTGKVADGGLALSPTAVAAAWPNPNTDHSTVIHGRNKIAGWIKMQDSEQRRTTIKCVGLVKAKLVEIDERHAPVFPRYVRKSVN